MLPSKPKRTSRGAPASQGQGQQQEQTRPLGWKVARLAALTLLSRFGRRVPVFTWFVAPTVSSPSHHSCARTVTLMATATHSRYERLPASPARGMPWRKLMCGTG